MFDRWEKYNRKLDEEFKPLMRLLNITVYGSYFPKSEKQFLINQADFLRKKGYTNTFIVDEYPSPSLSISNLELSIRCLEFSDVNFLIFTRNGKNQGVSRELAHIATSTTMVDKVQFCTVFDQVKDEQGSVPPLSLDDINNSGILRREFNSEQQLQTAV